MGRYYHGIITYMSRPMERQYFILDSKEGIMHIFRTLFQNKATSSILVC